MASSDLLIEVQFEEQNGLVRWLTKALGKLAEGLQPTHFGRGERRVIKPTTEIANRERYSEFLKHNGYDCCLYGSGYFVDVSPFDTRPSDVTVWGKVSDAHLVRCAPRVFQFLSHYGATYGYACEFEELEARNQYHLEYSGGGSCDGWFGRDSRRCVPGLYWLNYFSTPYLECHPMDIDALVTTLGAHAIQCDGGVILCLYEKPSDWRNAQERVGEVIHQTEGVFSARDVEIPKAETMTRRDGTEWIDEVFKRWP